MQKNKEKENVIYKMYVTLIKSWVLIKTPLVYF